MVGAHRLAQTLLVGSASGRLHNPPLPKGSEGTASHHTHPQLPTTPAPPPSGTRNHTLALNPPLRFATSVLRLSRQKRGLASSNLPLQSPGWPAEHPSVRLGQVAAVRRPGLVAPLEHGAVPHEQPGSLRDASCYRSCALGPPGRHPKPSPSYETTWVGHPSPSILPERPPKSTKLRTLEQPECIEVKIRHTAPNP